MMRQLYSQLSLSEIIPVLMIRDLTQMLERTQFLARLEDPILSSQFHLTIYCQSLDVHLYLNALLGCKSNDKSRPKTNDNTQEHHKPYQFNT
ncbi:hypothetical protein LINPERPRIM_LOCUS31827 [Linum perenne]